MPYRPAVLRMMRNAVRDTTRAVVWKYYFDSTIVWDDVILEPGPVAQGPVIVPD